MCQNHKNVYKTLNFIKKQIKGDCLDKKCVPNTNKFSINFVVVTKVKRGLEI